MSSCAEHLDAEYAELCGRLVAKLSRKRPSPLVRGDLRVWAAGVLYTIGRLNFLSDPSQQAHLSTDELSTLTDVAKSTLANKAKVIRDTLRIRPWDPEFQTTRMLQGNPLLWLIRVNGVIVDARMMPSEVQEEARRKGLIPELPTPREG